MALTAKQLEQFRKQLGEKRDVLIEAAQRTIKNEMVVPQDERFDEVDQASTEYMQAFSFKLRGRERHLLVKIDVAIKKLESGTFGMCEDCEEQISLKRLEARPEAPLCIQCKEAQEREEQVYAEE